MTNKEFNEKLKKLNDACFAETEARRREMEIVNAKKAAAHGEIALLKAKVRELGIEYNRLGYEINEIRSKYAQEREILELDRPEAVNAPAPKAEKKTTKAKKNESKNS